MWIETLTSDECRAVLSRNHVASLACSQAGQPYVVPVTYAFADNHLYGLSGAGKKIDWMRSNPVVCVQVLEHVGERGWRSVVINGVYEDLFETPRHQHEREFAWSLLSRHANWWEPAALKPTSATEVAEAATHLFYWIRIDEMTGRQARDEAAP